MFTDDDRKELERVLDIVYREMKEAIQLHRVLPNSITNNAETVGVTIEIRKIYDKPNVDYSGEDH